MSSEIKQLRSIANAAENLMERGYIAGPSSPLREHLTEWRAIPPVIDHFDFGQLLKALNLSVLVRQKALNLGAPARQMPTSCDCDWSYSRWWSMKDGKRCQELSLSEVIEYIADQMLRKSVRKNVRAAKVAREQ